MAGTFLGMIGACLRLVLSYVFSPRKAFEIILPNIWARASKAGFDPAHDIPDLKGKIILVTGANTGIGFETVAQLLKHDPKHIYLAARTESKARRAIDRLKSKNNQNQVSWLPLDLTSLSSIKRAAEKVLQESTRLDILILNAGIMATPASQTDAGHDSQLATNHIGHFFLTKLLLPMLIDTARLPNSDVRVVAVASEANSMAPAFETILSTEKLIRADPLTRYGASKASNIMFAAELARRCPMLTSVSVHPGFIRTELYSASASASSMLRMLLCIVSWMFVSVQDGALTQLYLAAGARKDDLVNGQYYTPYGAVRQNRWTDSIEYGVSLWEWTDAELKKAGY